MVDANQILNVELFDGLTEEQRTSIANLAEEHQFSEGASVFREGTRAEHIFVLLEGKVTIRIHLTSRPETLTVSVINQPYQSFGWSGIVSPHFFTASAYCESDCRLFTIPGKELMEIFKNNPETGFLVMCRISEMISNRLRSSRQVLLKTL